MTRQMRSQTNMHSQVKIKPFHRPNSRGRNYSTVQQQLPPCLSNLQKTIEQLQLEISKKQKEGVEHKLDFSKIFFHQKSKQREIEAIRTARNYLAPSLNDLPKELSRLDRTCSLCTSMLKKLEQHDLDKGLDHASLAFCNLFNVTQKMVDQEALFLKQTPEETAQQIAKRACLFFLKRKLPCHTACTISKYRELTQLPQEVIRNAFKAYRYAHLHKTEPTQKSKFYGALVKIDSDYALFVHVERIVVLNKKKSFDETTHEIIQAIQLLPEVNLKLEAITAKNSAWLEYEQYKRQDCPTSSLEDAFDADSEYEQYCKRSAEPAFSIGKQYIIQPLHRYKTASGTFLIRESTGMALSSGKETIVIRTLHDLAAEMKEGKANKQEAQTMHLFFSQGLQAVKAMHDRAVLPLDLSLKTFIIKTNKRCVMEPSNCSKAKEKVEQPSKEIEQQLYTQDISRLAMALNELLHTAKQPQTAIDQAFQGFIDDALSAPSENTGSLDAFIERFQTLKQQFIEAIIGQPQQQPDPSLAVPLYRNQER